MKLKTKYFFLFLFLPSMAGTQTALRKYSVSDFTGGLLQSVAPNLIPDKYCTSVSNIVTDESFSIKPRKNITSQYSLPGGVFQNSYVYRRSDGTEKFVVQTSSTLYYLENGVWTQIATGFSRIQKLNFTNHDNYLVWANGVDYVGYWDGIAVSTPTYIPRFRFPISHKEKLFGAWTSDEPSYVYCNRTGYVWNTDEAWDTQNALDVSSEDGQPITGLKQFGAQLIVYKENSTYQISGSDVSDFVIRQLSKIYGMLPHGNAGYWKNSIVALDNDGIAGYNGSMIKILSDPISPFINNLRVNSVKKGQWTVSTDNDFDQGTYQNTFVKDGTLFVSTQIITLDTDSEFRASGSSFVYTTTTTENMVRLDLQSGTETRERLFYSNEVVDIGKYIDLTNTNPNLYDGDWNSYTKVIFRSGTMDDSYFTLKPASGITWSRIKFKYGMLPYTNQRRPAFNVSIVTENGEEYLYSKPASVGTINPGFLIVPDLYWRAETVEIKIDTNTYGSNLLKIRFYGKKFDDTGPDEELVIYEVEAYAKNAPAYYTTGSWTSASQNGGIGVDWLKAVPDYTPPYNTSYGTITFYSATSSNGTDWNAETALSTVTWNIDSLDAQYLKIKAGFESSSNTYSPHIDAITIYYANPSSGCYFSKRMYLGDSLSAYGSFYETHSGTASWYIKGSTSSSGLANAAFSGIANGNSISVSTNSRWIQIASTIAYASSNIAGFAIDWYIYGSSFTSITMSNYKDRLYVGCSTSTANNDTLVVYDSNGAWYMYKDFQSNGLQEYMGNLYSIDSAGTIYQIEYVDSAGTNALFTTKDFDFDSPDLEKSLVYAYYTGKKNTSDYLNVAYYTDYSTYAVTTHTIDFSSNSNVRKTFPIVNCKNFHCVFSSTGTFELQKISWYYTLKDLR